MELTLSWFYDLLIKKKVKQKGKEIHQKNWMATDLPHSNSLDAYPWNAKTVEVHKWRGELYTNVEHLSMNWIWSTCEWGEQREVPLISILGIFVELSCNNIERIY